MATNNGRSGCGGGYAKACEKLGGLAFFAGALPEGTHTLRLTNNGPLDGQSTYFDFDYLEYSTPSAYSTAKIVNATCPFAECVASAVSSPSSISSGAAETTSFSSSPSSSAAQATKSSAGSPSMSSGAGALAMVLGAWVMRKLMA